MTFWKSPKEDQSYWLKNYDRPLTMDGVGNAKEHARYLRAFFNLENQEINSVIDWGPGLGAMLLQIKKAFRPEKICGVEPSAHAGNTLVEKFENHSIDLIHQDLMTYLKNESKSRNPKVYDLGICTSVFQYLKDNEVGPAFRMMSKLTRYLYFSVPTALEYQRQKKEVEFFDEYAKTRTKQWYLDSMRPFFTVVGARVLESKYFFNAHNSPFTDLLFRF